VEVATVCGDTGTQIYRCVVTQAHRHIKVADMVNIILYTCYACTIIQASFIHVCAFVTFVRSSSYFSNVLGYLKDKDTR
jgi:hypothetical protein